ncbi:MAG: DUF5689 domain-containing protein [Crocinitomicaceae bacterium]|nr:DUF5689 domain-containing protein [Crocinitomicaceae bacterium]
MKLTKALIPLTLLFVFTSCKKEYETPPIIYPTELENITIDSLRQMQEAQTSVSFNQNYTISGIVTMDETDGNIYKNIYLQDHSAAINVRLLSGGGLYVGDSIKIILNGCYLNKFNGVVQLDSVGTDINVIKKSSANAFPPEITTIDQLTTLKESQLIQLNDVQFVNWELGEKYADKINQLSKDHLLEDANGNTVVVRTSGYASFADEAIASGNGNIVLIAAVYNGEMQLLIRSFSEVNLNNPRFTGISLYKDFNDDEILSGNWTTHTLSGSFTSWETSSAGGAPNPYAAISNYDGTGNEVAEVWLISPSFDLSASTAPKLSFENAYNYNGPQLEVKVSTDYVSGEPNSGTWTDLSSLANWSSGNFTFINSGDIDLSAYTNSNVHIAFKYVGTATDGSTWEIDNIIIKG